MGGDPATTLWMVLISTRVLTVSLQVAGKSPDVVGVFNTSSMANGVPVAAWNLLRVRAECPSNGDECPMTVWLNPEAHPTEPDLGKVEPRLQLSPKVDMLGIVPASHAVRLQAQG